MAQVVTTCQDPPLINMGPTVHWVGLETLMGLLVEEQEVTALADSGSQVNTVMPNFVYQYEFPILSLRPPIKLNWVRQQMYKAYGGGIHLNCSLKGSLSLMHISCSIALVHPSSLLSNVKMLCILGHPLAQPIQTQLLQELLMSCQH